MSITFSFRAPIHRPTEQRPLFAPADVATTRLRVSGWIVAAAKKVLPAIAVLAVFAAVVAATIALRLAIWLPLYLRP